MDHVKDDFFGKPSYLFFYKFEIILCHYVFCYHHHLIISDHNSIVVGLYSQAS